MLCGSKSVYLNNIYRRLVGAKKRKSASRWSVGSETARFLSSKRSFKVGSAARHNKPYTFHEGLLFGAEGLVEDGVQDVVRLGLGVQTNHF